MATITFDQKPLAFKIDNFAMFKIASAEGDIVRIFIDHEQTGKKKEEIQNLLNDIFR